MTDSSPELASLFNAAGSGNAAATAALEQHFKSQFPENEPEPGPGTWPAPTPAASPPAWASMAEGATGIPPDATHYAVPADLEEVAPAAAAQLREWGYENRLSVSQVGALGTHLDRLARMPLITSDRVMKAEGDALVGRLSGSDHGRQVLARAHQAWRGLEQRCPQLADLLLDLNAPSDLAFVECLAATVRR